MFAFIQLILRNHQDGKCKFWDNPGYTFNFWRLRWPKNKNKLYILKRVGMQNAKENEINLRSEIDKKQI